MTFPIIGELPEPPRRNEPEGFFVPKANAFLASFPQMRIDFNAAGEYVEINAQSAALSASSALVNASYKGEWSQLTGSINTPSSVSHDGKRWQLLENLANVTLWEPGISTKWEEIRNKVTEIYSMADLKLYGLGLYNGQQIDLLGFYPDTPGSGGGSLFWDADRPKADHNGGTIVDPSHTATPGAKAWYTAENTGTGCWVRMMTDSAVNAKWFGAKGDNQNDDSTALQTVINLFTNIYVPRGTYKVMNLTLLGKRTIVGEKTHGAGIGNATTFFVAEGNAHCFRHFGGCYDVYLKDFVISTNSNNLNVTGVGLDPSVTATPLEKLYMSGTFENIEMTAQITTGFFSAFIFTLWDRCAYGTSGSPVPNSCFISTDDVRFAQNNINKIQNCFIFRTTSSALLLRNWNNLHITNTDFERNSGSIISGSSLVSLNVENCWFENTSSLSDRYIGLGVSIMQNSSITFRNNYFNLENFPGEYLIRAASANGFVFEENHINRGTGCGLLYDYNNPNLNNVDVSVKSNTTTSGTFIFPESRTRSPEYLFKGFSTVNGTLPTDAHKIRMSDSNISTKGFSTSYVSGNASGEVIYSLSAEEVVNIKLSVGNSGGQYTFVEYTASSGYTGANRENIVNTYTHKTENTTSPNVSLSFNDRNLLLVMTNGTGFVYKATIISNRFK